MQQLVTAGNTKIASGSLSTKVSMSNVWTYERIEDKDIFDDPCKVLKKAAEARKSTTNKWEEISTFD